MKINIFLIFILILPACRTEKKVDLNLLKANLEIVFEDNFSNENLDTSKWTTVSSSPRPFDRILPRGNCDFNNAAILNNSNVVLKDGILNLIAKEENQTYEGVVGGDQNQNVGCDFIGGENFRFDQNYTSGSIFGRKGFNHGLFECRAKIPAAKGLYPVFWLWHHDEIVVFEFFGDRKEHFVSAHRREKYVTQKFSDMDYSEAFHEYSVYWTPHEITWFIDGKNIWTLCRNNNKNCTTSSKPHNSNFKIEESFPDSTNRWLSPNISLRIYEWSKEVDGSRLPDTLMIDYIRIYQTKADEK